MSRRAALRLGMVGAVGLVAACDDEAPGALAPDAAGADAGVDAAADASAAETGEADAGIDAGADGEADGSSGADAGADQASPDLAAEARRPGILTVPPDDPDVSAKEITYPGAVPVRAYLALPNRVGSFAGILLIHDERGLTEHIKDVARRLAKTGGCAALAPDLASRAGGSAALGDGVSGYLAGARLEDLLADLSAGLGRLAQEAQIGAGRYGTCGFSWGGTLALGLCAADARVRAAVVYYASTPAPADTLKSTSAAVLGLYAAADVAVNSGIAELERVMKDAGKVFDKRLYEGTGHGFYDDTGPTYDEDAAVSAWSATIPWFDGRLG
jgi:carboxymethylenebutenolidase